MLRGFNSQQFNFCEKSQHKLSLAKDWLKVGLRVNQFGKDMKIVKEIGGVSFGSISSLKVTIWIQV